jgi:hypothetical protein
LYASASGGTTANYAGIFDAGNVGIGTTGPAYPLDVTGNIRATNTVYANANGAKYFCGGDDACLYDVNVQNTVGIEGVEDATHGNLQLGSGGATISGYGTNIGIGLTGPDHPLTVQTGASNAGIHLVGTTVGDVRFTVNNGAGSYNNISAYGDTVVTWYSGYGLVFAPATTGPSGVRITNAGWVGIGVSSPATPLDIETYVSLSPSSYEYYSDISGDGYWGHQSSAYAGNYSIKASGAILAVEYDATSDRRLKKDIAEISSEMADSFIAKARPVRFHWINQPKQKERFGFIAQEVSKIGFDSLVGGMPNDKIEKTVDPDGFVSPKGFEFNLDYEGVIPLLTKAAQNLKVLIDGVVADVKQIKDHLANDVDPEIAALKAANENQEKEIKNQAKEIQELRALIETHGREIEEHKKGKP